VSARVVDAAEAEPTRERAREALLAGMVELTIGVGRSLSAVLSVGRKSSHSRASR